MNVKIDGVFTTKSYVDALNYYCTQKPYVLFAEVLCMADRRQLEEIEMLLRKAVENVDKKIKEQYLNLYEEEDIDALVFLIQFVKQRIQALNFDEYRSWSIIR